MNRNLKMVPVATSYIAELLKFPEGAFVRGVYFDYEKDVFNFIVYHPDFPETQEGYELKTTYPMYTVTHHECGHNTVTADWEYDEEIN